MANRDLKLTDGDLTLEGGDLVLVSDLDAIAQSAAFRLRFFQGEWFLDLSAGVPFFQDVLVKNPDPNVLQATFRKALEDTPGVLEVLSLELDFDRATRALSVSFRCSTDLGEITATEVL